MNKNHLISVIIPFYNSWGTLGRAVDSVLKQTFQSFELILINDGSNDKSNDEYRDAFCKDPRITLLNKENGGLSSARQAGIDFSNGDYFCTLDADDFYEIHFLEKMLDIIISSKADIAVCGRSDLTRSGLKHYPIEATQSYKSDACVFSDYFGHCMSHFKLGDSWNKLYKTSFVKNTGVKYHLPKGFHGNDYLFNHELLFNKPFFVSISDCLIIHDVTNVSMTRKYSPNKMAGFYYIFESILSLAHKNKVAHSIIDYLNSEFTILTTLCIKNWMYYCNKNKIKNLKTVFKNVDEANNTLHISIDVKYSRTKSDKRLVHYCKKHNFLVLSILSLFYRIKKWKKR